MNGPTKQQLSELIDDELPTAAALAALDKALRHPEALRTLNRYAAISQAIKSGQFTLPSDDFAARVSARIAHEPAYLLAPAAGKPAGRRRQPWVAMAASVAGIAVFAAHSLMRPAQTTDGAPLWPARQPQAALAGKTQRGGDQEPLNARIYDYLQAHNNSVYTGNLKPLIKVTAYSQHP